MDLLQISRAEISKSVLENYFDDVALIDLSDNKLIFFNITESSLLHGIWLEDHVYEYQLDKIVGLLVAEDQDLALTEMSMESIQMNLEESSEYSRVYNVVTTSGKIVNKKIICKYFDLEKSLVIITCNDITAEKNEQLENNKMLNAACLNAERANNIKTEFLSRMSHDIRTPLNGIIGITDIAIENIDRTDKVLHCLERIQFASNYLLSIVSDILDMSRIDSGKINITQEYFVMDDLVKNVCSVLEEEAYNKNIEFIKELDPSLQYGFVGDPLHIKQVLVNLLSNAVKYTNAGGRVVLKITPCNQPEGVTFEVSDNGIGISEEFQKKMFEPFEQASNTSGTYVTGAGLGLSIVNKLLSLMGGALTVESTLGLGSTFTVSIPLQKDKEEHSEDVKIVKPFIKQRFFGQRILIVEDNEINMEIVKTMLSSANLQYDAAWNGLECVNLFSKSSPGYYSAVLMDIRMPVMDGREATRRIRLMQRVDSRVPIIALSADAFSEEIRAAQAVGMDDYIIKPVNKDTLLSVLDKFINN